MHADGDKQVFLSAFIGVYRRFHLLRSYRKTTANVRRCTRMETNRYPYRRSSACVGGSKSYRRLQTQAFPGDQHAVEQRAVPALAEQAVPTAGLIRRELDADDRRASRLALTEAGRQKLAASSTTYAAELATMLDATLNATEQQHLHTLVKRLLTAVENGEP